MSLKTRLTAGAVALTAATVLTALVLLIGMAQVGVRMQAALQAEARMARYSTLSTQVSTFLVVATEAVQRGLSPETRADRLDPVAAGIRETFAALNGDLEQAVSDAERLDLDTQSRFGTQSLLLARMAASVDQTMRGLGRDMDPISLRAWVDSFASRFDPLLNEAVNTEVLFRRETLAGIETLRARLTWIAVGLAALSVAMAVAFYAGLIQPQFRRLDLLRDAARRIGAQDFALSLPDTRADEIGRLYRETDAAARLLADRQAEVAADRAHLNEIIEARTEALSAANARLSEIDESRRRLFADISHELRTPLTVILMEAQLGRQVVPGARDVFDTIETRAARLNRRIDDLLRVARSDSGVLALSPEAVPLGVLLAEAAEEVSAECASAGVALTVDAVDGTVTADRNWLRQVLVGLIRNALRHARDGGAVTVAAEPDGMLSVTDNGPGIPAAAQERLFDRFTQGTPNRAGFGLGLALAKWVIEEHGGSVAIESPVAEPIGDAPGTKVVLRLPADPR
ncbi:HAMP domain-containing histidine kinase [Sagittula sp. M10.9X]|uniref:histidine kinase n=2 Tax=Sagittula salina TaxID=2820268 RepID=A0A940MMT0_9RHOB|nr:HAMP domain-containing sensor histidine kinase [Sagittula salina]MBP0484765.1 HAMP domain-containing histidine kinase [Sagittula salina]